MEQSDLQQVVLLFDTYSPDSKRLHKSFKIAERPYPAVTIEENGFLPDDVKSVYGYFLGDYAHALNVPGRPRYFNEIEIPDYWEIEASNVSGTIRDLYHERGRIFFAPPSNKRHVQAVDWLDEQGRVRYTDHYNKYGAIYARTTFNEKQELFAKSYFDPEGKEIIVENFVTHDIILNTPDGCEIFNNKTELAVYFFQLTGLDRYPIYFNSLSVPFFVSCRLDAKQKQDVLFWQEPITDSIPGNMQIILDGGNIRAGKIYVQKAIAYKRLLQLGANPEIVREKGFLYPFRRENQHRASVLICTNSDQIEQCETIVSALPGVEFHIAALTEMSSKLMSMEQYENVHLYPGAKTEMLSRLFRSCDVYLDINHANEIVSAVQQAFLNNQLILAFPNTLHNIDLVDQANIFQNAADMIEMIRKAVSDPVFMDEKLERQRKYALSESVDSFLHI